MTAVLFFLGRILGGRFRWIFQLLLVLVNVFAGEKTATAALILIGAAGYIFERPWRVRQVAVAAVLISWFSVIALLNVNGIINIVPARYITGAAAAIYGDKVSNEISTLDGRAEVWKKSQELASDGVLVGYGMEGAREALLHAVYWSGQAHNGLLEVVLDGGVLAAVLFTIGWLNIVALSLRGSRVWTVRVGCLQGMILILSAIGPIFTFYSFFAQALVISLSYMALQAKTQEDPSSTRPDLALIERSSRLSPVAL